MLRISPHIPPVATPAQSSVAPSAQAPRQPVQEQAAKSGASLEAWQRYSEGLGERTAKLDELWERGRYPAIVSEIARHLERVDEKVFASLGAGELMPWVAELYILQQRMLAVSNKLDMSDQRAAKLQACELLGRIGKLTTRAFLRAVELQQQKETAPVASWAVYKNTLKQPGFHPQSTLDTYYIDKTLEFIRKGGDLEQIKPVTLEFLQSLKSGELCEWVVTAHDDARITRSEAPVAPNHTVLSGGQDVLSAGSLRIFKNEAGELDHVIVGTFSGHFRPDLPSLQHMVRHVVAAGVDPARVSVQEGEAASPRALPEIVFKLAGLAGAEAQRAMASILAGAHGWAPDNAVVPKEAKPKPKDAGKSAPAAGEPIIELRTALFTLRSTVARALEDGVVLSAQREASGLARAFDTALSACAAASDHHAYTETMALLGHVAGLGPKHMDAEAQKILAEVQGRWQARPFGSGPRDPADVLGARPVGRRTRIMATINPKADEATLAQMIGAGMDIARLNLARGTVEDHEALIQRIRNASAAVGKDVKVLIDLPGPKIRLGYFDNPKQLEKNDIFLQAGETVTLTTADVKGNAKLLPVEYEWLGKDVKVGEPIFLNDGHVQLVAKAVKVDAKTGVATVDAEVVQGGKVWDRKGINLPESTLSAPTVPPEDVAMLTALAPHVDLVGLSFVRSAEDVLFVRGKLAGLGRMLPLIAKIERREAMAQLESIGRAADAMMVARGDLGVELGYERVPAAERRINQMGNVLGKPTIVATEVLESMARQGARPTRADVEGVYSAVYDQGAECIMLGKETSGGEFPVEAVRAGVRIVKTAEDEMVEDAARYAAMRPATQQEAEAVAQLVRGPVEQFMRGTQGKV